MLVLHCFGPWANDICFCNRETSCQVMKRGCNTTMCRDVLLKLCALQHPAPMRMQLKTMSPPPGHRLMLGWHHCAGHI